MADNFLPDETDQDLNKKMLAQLSTEDDENDSDSASPLGGMFGADSADGEMSMSQKIGLIGAAILPTLVGAALGGQKGAMAGAGATGAGLAKGGEFMGQQEMAKQKIDAAAKEKADYLKMLSESKANAAKTAAEAAAGEKEKERLWKEGQAAKDRELKKELSGKKPGADLTPGEAQLDKTFAKEYDEWTSQGKAIAEKNLAKLKESRTKLEKTKNDLIGTSGPITGRLPNFLRSKEGRELQQNVQEPAVGALRATLGAQFTEKEGERIQAYAYDPTLSPDQNMKKVDAAIGELESRMAAKDAKAGHFEQHGTLKGWKTPSDNYASNDGKDQVRNINGKPYRKVSGGWELVK